MQKMSYKKIMGLQETFIKNLKFYRKEKAISQKDLSIALNKGLNYINSIECGASFPPPQMVDEIAAILKIEPEILFSKSGCPENIRDEEKAKISPSLKADLIKGILSEIERVLG